MKESCKSCRFQAFLQELINKLKDDYINLYKTATIKNLEVFYWQINDDRHLPPNKSCT